MHISRVKYIIEQVIKQPRFFECLFIYTGSNLTGNTAGGPDYLLQLMIPRTIAENTMRRGFAPADDIL